MQGEPGDAGAPGMNGDFGEDGDDGPDVSIHIMHIDISNKWFLHITT